jgi:hypothetical protein
MREVGRLTLKSPVKLTARRTARRIAQTDSGSINAALEADFIAAPTHNDRNGKGATGKAPLMFTWPWLRGPILQVCS